MIKHFPNFTSLTFLCFCCMPMLGGEIPLSRLDGTLAKLRMPDAFALVFSFGYVHDHMPKDRKTFEDVLKHMKRTGINAIHCKYYPWRQQLCEKHGIRMLIDLAVPEHDLKQAFLCGPDEVAPSKDLLKGDERFSLLQDKIKGINLECERVNKMLRHTPQATELKQRLNALKEKKKRLEKKKSIEIGANVKAICEKARNSQGVWGYGLWYDNGTSGSFLNHAVEKLRQWDPTHVTYVGSYRHRGLETVTINPGCYGWYDYHWSRGRAWHYLDMLIGHPVAYYSTPVTEKQGGREAQAKPSLPRWCKPFPNDHWIQVISGEALVGIFTYPDGTDAVYVASHQAFLPQKIILQIKKNRW